MLENTDYMIILNLYYSIGSMYQSNKFENIYLFVLHSSEKLGLLLISFYRNIGAKVQRGWLPKIYIPNKCQKQSLFCDFLTPNWCPFHSVPPVSIIR